MASIASFYKDIFLLGGCAFLSLSLFFQFSPSLLDSVFDTAMERLVVRKTNNNETSLNASTSSKYSTPPPPTASRMTDRLCSMAELTTGVWVNATYERPPYLPMRGEVQQKACEGLDPDGPWQTWEWQPTNAATSAAAMDTTTTTTSRAVGCQFLRFDPDLYCQLMANKTVAIVGDSISFDHFLSLTHLLGVPQALPRARTKDAKLVSHVCQQQTSRSTGTATTTSTLIGQRDFFLERIPQAVNGNDTTTPTASQHDIPDVLVVNRGAHYTEDAVFLADFRHKILPALRQWQWQCEQRHQQQPHTRRNNNNHHHHHTCLLIYRTTVPGHPNCTQYQQPFVGSVQDMERIIAADPTSVTYHWDRFATQNQLVLDLLLEQQQQQQHQQQQQNVTASSKLDASLMALNYRIMDGYPMNILRPDRHKSGSDCLHSVRYVTVCSVDLRCRYEKGK